MLEENEYFFETHSLLSSKLFKLVKLLGSSKPSKLDTFCKLLEFHMLLDEDNELTTEDPMRDFAWVKLKLSLISLWLTGDIFRAHLV